MALHQGTMKLTPAQANVIPVGKYIYTDETFLVKQPIASVEAFPRGRLLPQSCHSEPHPKECR